ncbi:MAG: hypothetical protein ACFFCL_05835 [Promethearchaeota archaeon]
MSIMYQKSKAVQKAREDLIQQNFEEICEEGDFNKLRGKTYCVFAKLWLHNEAEKEGLFKLKEWSNPEKRPDLIDLIRQFLNKHIK